MKKLSKKQILILVFLAGLVFLIPLVLSLVKQKQEIREKAAGSGIVQIKLIPQQASLRPGQSLSLQVTLQSSQNQGVNAANTKLIYDKNVFDVSTPTCGTNFPTSAGNSVDSNGGFIYVGCGVAGGSPPVNVSSTPVVLGEFQITVKSNISSQQTQIDLVVSPQLPYISDPDGMNLAGEGAGGVYTILSQTMPVITSTPTPTSTPVPTRILTLTPVPTSPPLTLSPTYPVTGLAGKTSSFLFLGFLVVFIGLFLVYL